MKTLFLAFAAAIGFAMPLGVIVSDVAARAVSHQVTPKNIDEQPFAFKVTVKGVNDEKLGPSMDFEIRVSRKLLAPGPGENGSIDVVSRCHRKVESALKIATPSLTIVKSDDALIHTFRISDRDLDRAVAHFTYAIPDPGDYYQFNLHDFLPDDGGSTAKTTAEVKPQISPARTRPGETESPPATPRQIGVRFANRRARLSGGD
ncbi:MAG TPA: hypothetical protein VKB78_04305 [Pirellulales bacterium]|nr:hypothetical protein [Pirellulales bacterium]